MMSRLTRNKPNSKMARLNIAYHIGNAAKRNNISVEQAVTNFLASVISKNTTTYLIGASKIADPKNSALKHSQVVKWVNKWGRSIPKGQQRKARKTRANKLDCDVVAAARKIVVEFILSRRKVHRWSLYREITNFQERLRFDRLPPYVKTAAKEGHARPGQKQDLTLSRTTLYKWINCFEDAGYNIDALKPVPSKFPNPPYDNDNNPER